MCVGVWFGLVPFSTDVHVCGGPQTQRPGEWKFVLTSTQACSSTRSGKKNKRNMRVGKTELAKSEIVTEP